MPATSAPTRPALVLLLALVGLVAACGPGPAPSTPSTPSTPPPSPTVASPSPVVAAPPTPVLGQAAPLVTFRAHGGHCQTGECEFVAEIRADGTVTRSDGMEQVVDPMSLGLLTTGIEAADWEAILANPFTGDCPTAYDGQEQVYTFHVEPEPVVVASCTTIVDPSVEPFQTVSGILFGTGG